MRRAQWKPTLESAGLPHARIYDLRHSFATWALDAGLSIFELARHMGTSVEMIDRVYGHLAHGRRTPRGCVWTPLRRAFGPRSGHS